MSVTAVPIRPIRKGSVLKLWLGLALLALVAAAIAWFGTSKVFLTTPSGLKYRVIKEGQGPHPGPMDVATFDYVGRLPDGTIFDSSQGKPPAQVPVFGVVPGFSEGLRLMNKGAVYELKVPPQLAYGMQGSPPTIPPNTVLDFEVTLRDFRALTPREMQQLQMMMMQQQMGGGQGGPR